MICTTEFGRQPASQGGKGLGRDHNSGAFTAWFGGESGRPAGATDELGFRAQVTHLLLRFARDCFTCWGSIMNDYPIITMLQRRLTDVHGKVLADLLA